MIQLNLTAEGLSAKTRNTNLIFTKWITGSGVDENLSAIQTQKQIVPIAFLQVYNKGQQYTLDSTTYTETIDHVKITGNIQSNQATEEYILSEIALMAKEGDEGEEFVFAYGTNAQERIIISPEENTSYSIIVDVLFETTPNISVTTTETGVTYGDLFDHINKQPTDTVHGIGFENGDLKINNVSLDICKNNIFQKTTGATVADTLPVASLAYDTKLYFDKTNNALFKCSKTEEIEVGDYIYKDNNDVWQVGDGTEQGALEVVADSATPASTEITLTMAQNLFMAWNSVNSIDKRLSLVESVSLGGITDIIDTLQNQIESINNALSNPFPAWGASTTFAVGDICIANTFKSYQYLECVVAGESGTTTPSYSAVGQLVTDNEVKWLVCDFRDSNPVGTYKTDVIQRDGWIKANGATVNRVDYPRLWAWAVANSLTTNDTTNYPALFGVGDGSTTFTLPNFDDYFIRYSFTRNIGNKQASQMASHTHTCQNDTTSHDHTAGNQNANHNHDIFYTEVYLKTDSSGNMRRVIGGNTNRYTSTQASASHSHTINSKSITHGHTINATGSGSNTYPDNITMQMFIKY